MTKAHDMRFGCALRKLMQKGHHKNRDVCKYAHVGPATIVQWTKGCGYPTMSQCAGLQDGLRLKRGDLWSLCLPEADSTIQTVTHVIANKIQNNEVESEKMEQIVETPVNAPVSPCNEPENNSSTPPRESKPKRFEIIQRSQKYSYSADMGVCKASVSSELPYIELTEGADTKNSIRGYITYENIPDLIEDLEWLLKHRGECPA